MAQLPKIRRNNPISDFQRVTPEAGGAFRVLAEMANDAYEFLKPAAIAEQKAAGAEAGREMARRQAGDNRVPLPNLPRNSREGLSRVSSSGIDPSSTNVEHAFNRFKAAGIPDHVAAGLVGNLMQESGQRIDPRAVGDNGNAFGAAQHNGDRREALFAFAEANGKDPADLDTQIDFILHEGQTTEKSAFDAIMTAQTAEEAALIASERFWRPGVPHNERRQAYANSVLRSLGVEPDTPQKIAADTMEALGIERQVAEEALQVAAVSSQGPATTVRTKEGKIEPRLYSPMSGEILQAHNAAAGVAYISERVNAGIEDLMNLSFQTEGEPQAFKQAAEEYLRSVIEDAPDMFKEDLRADLQNEVQRRYLGMVDERHTEIRQRADNNSRALAERYGKDYAEALASGQNEEAAAARAKLEDVLFARESLPGAAWTRAQSENFLIGAMDDAAKLKGEARTRQSNEIEDRLDLINDAAKDFRTASDEDILSDPMVWELHPDKAREAASRVAFRDTFPGFMSLPPAEMERQIAAERERPVDAEFQLDFLKPMEDAAKAARAGLREDPIAFAQQHFGNSEMGAPPKLDIEAALTDQRGFIRAVQEREQYAKFLQENGFTSDFVPLSKEEATALGTILGAEQDPLARAILVDTMVRAAPEATLAALNQAEVDDNIKFGAGLSVATGNAILLKEAMVGQELIKAGQVSLPKNSRNMNAIAPSVSLAMSGLPGGAEAQAKVMRFAEALYAANSTGVTDESQQAKIMEKSVQRALGQSTNASGEVTGGVQEVMGFDVALPVGVSAKEVEAFMTAPLPIMRNFPDRIGGLFEPAAPEGLGMIPEPALRMDLMRDASRWGGEPTFNGTPITSDAFRDGRMRIVATGGPYYRMEYIGQGGVGSGINVTQPDGSIYEFDLKKLIGGQ